MPAGSKDAHLKYTPLEHARPWVKRKLALFPIDRLRCRRALSAFAIGSPRTGSRDPEGGAFVVMDRFEKRWRQRQDGAPGGPGPATVTVTVSKQVAVRVDPDRLWDLVWDPATSPLVLDEVVAAFTLPGTPAGQVGEMQVNIVAGEGGTLFGMIEEVVEVGPGYRAVTRSRSTALPATSITLILPLDQGGCVLRHRHDSSSRPMQQAWYAMSTPHIPCCTCPGCGSWPKGNHDRSLDISALGVVEALPFPLPERQPRLGDPGDPPVAGTSGDDGTCC